MGKRAIRKGDWVRFRKPDAYHAGVVERRNRTWVYFNDVRGGVVEARPGELVVMSEEELLGLVWEGLLATKWKPPAQLRAEFRKVT